MALRTLKAEHAPDTTPAIEGVELEKIVEIEKKALGITVRTADFRGFLKHFTKGWFENEWTDTSTHSQQLRTQALQHAAWLYVMGHPDMTLSHDQRRAWIFAIWNALNASSGNPIELTSVSEPSIAVNLFDAKSEEPALPPDSWRTAAHVQKLVMRALDAHNAMVRKEAGKKENFLRRSVIEEDLIPVENTALKAFLKRKRSSEAYEPDFWVLNDNS